MGHCYYLCKLEVVENSVDMQWGSNVHVVPMPGKPSGSKYHYLCTLVHHGASQRTNHPMITFTHVIEKLHHIGDYEKLVD